MYSFVGACEGFRLNFSPETDLTELGLAACGACFRVRAERVARICVAIKCLRTILGSTQASLQALLDVFVCKGSPRLSCHQAFRRCWLAGLLGLSRLAGASWLKKAIPQCREMNHCLITPRACLLLLLQMPLMPQRQMP